MSFPPLVNMADVVLPSLSRLQARGGVSTIRLSMIGRKETWGPVEDTAALKACSRCFALASGNPRFLAALDDGAVAALASPNQGQKVPRVVLGEVSVSSSFQIRPSAAMAASGGRGPLAA
ncbi:hypothetical protein LEMLEM_LOCUS14415 [Lemmus lemmus]